MDPKSGPPRRSPRIADLSRLREQTESDKQDQLQRARQASITESEKQARNEKLRIVYRAKVAAAKAQPHGHAVQKSSVNAGRNIVTVPLTKYSTFPHRADGDYGAAKVAAAKAQPHGHEASSSGEHKTESSFILYQDEQAAEGTRKRKGKANSSVANEALPTQLEIERERQRLQQKCRRQNLTEEQKLIVRERDRIRKKPDKEKQNLPTTSNSAGERKEKKNLPTTSNSAGERRAESSFIRSCNPTNIDQVQCQNDQDAEASRKRKGNFIAPDQSRSSTR